MNSNKKIEDGKTKIMPTIEIWDSIGLGLIIQYPTGVLVSNQTGGTACLHPSEEGIYLPLRNDYELNTYRLISPEIELKEYFMNGKYQGTGAIEGIDLYDAEYINSVLSRYSLENLLKVDMEKLRQSHEAWIYVNIYTDADSIDLFSYFPSELKGVLTWSNSD